MYIYGEKYTWSVKKSRTHISLEWFKIVSRYRKYLWKAESTLKVTYLQSRRGDHRYIDMGFVLKKWGFFPLVWLNGKNPGRATAPNRKSCYGYGAWMEFLISAFGLEFRVMAPIFFPFVVILEGRLQLPCIFQIWNRLGVCCVWRGIVLENVCVWNCRVVMELI